MPSPNETFAVVGDVHGHLQLSLCMLARWQRELNILFDAVFLCGAMTGVWSAPI